jgi:hypothetical protein
VTASVELIAEARGGGMGDGSQVQELEELIMPQTSGNGPDAWKALGGRIKAIWSILGESTRGILQRACGFSCLKWAGSRPADVILILRACGFYLHANFFFLEIGPLAPAFFEGNVSCFRLGYYCCFPEIGPGLGFVLQAWLLE